MCLTGKIPMCKYCSNYARPNVCFTDDNSFCNKLRDAQKASFNRWIKSVANKRNTKLLILEIGCGRHRDAIGMTQLANGKFRIMSKELTFPDIFTTDNIKVLRVNPDRNTVTVMNSRFGTSMNMNPSPMAIAAKIAA